MNEYVPSIDDLRDFEEFQNERESENTVIGEFNGRKFYGTMYYVSKGDTVLKLLRETILDIIVADLSCVEGIEQLSVMNRLDNVELLGFDKYEIASVISPELSKDDLDMLFAGKQHPYLLKGINSWLGDGKITEAIAARKRAVKRRLLPYTAFDFISTSKNKEFVFVKQQLIEQTPFESRPLSGLRSYILRKGNELGYWDYHNYDPNVRPRVGVREFLYLLFSECQNIPETLKYQFNVTTTKYSIPSSKVRFSLPIIFIPLIEEYFNVAFKPSTIYNRKGGLTSFTVERKTDTLLLPIK